MLHLVRLMALGLLFGVCMLGSLSLAAEPAPADGKGKQLPIRRGFILPGLATKGRTFQVIQAWKYGEQDDKPVDFAKETVLLVAMGQRNTGGFRITVEEACELDDRVNVYVTEKSPGADEMVTMAFSWPYDLVALPKVNKPVYFIVQSMTGREKSGQPVTVYPIAASYQGQILTGGKAQTLVIRDTEAWAKLWKETLGIEKVPDVDFKKQMAALICLDLGSAGREVAVLSVQDDGQRLTVTYEVREQDGDVVALAVSPYTIIVIPASPREVVFQTWRPVGRGDRIKPVKPDIR